MTGDELRECARARVNELPGAQLEHPFGPDPDVYKVGGKIFMLLSGGDGEATATLKSDPEDSVALRDQYASIIPGYHMNKRHWITVRLADDLSPALIEELVTASYVLVVASLPRARRPIDPRTFGAAEA